MFSHSYAKKEEHVNAKIINFSNVIKAKKLDTRTGKILFKSKEE